MAKNRLIGQSNKRTPNITVTASLKSGDPTVVGNIPGVLLGDADAANTAVLQLDGVFNLLVDGVDQSGNSAVAKGDIIYFTVGDTIKLSKKNTGVRFGYADGTVTSGIHTTVIPVQIGY